MINLAGVSKTRIFVADDEMWYLEGVSDALESEGYEVIMEPGMTGTKALEILRDPESRIDILILDIMMDPGPELVKEVPSGTRTGISVCRKIRQDIKSDDPGFPIICLTVVDDESILSHVTEMDCTVLRKAEAGISDILEAVKNAEAIKR